MRRADQCIAQEKRWSADNTSLPVVLSRGLGAEAWDIEGKRYLDFMGAYSAANLGTAIPVSCEPLTEQACTLGVVSRAFHNDKLGAFLQKACETTGMDRALPMNSGAEAVETALKAARKWAYEVKGVPDGKAEIICCARNFHGRTTGVISMSSSDRARAGYGPYLGGFRNIPFGDADAGGGHRATHRGIPGRAHPGRGRHHRAAAGLSAGMRGPVPPPQRALSSPTRYRPDWDAPATCSRARRTMRVPTALCLARRWAAAWSRFPCSWRGAT